MNIIKDVVIFGSGVNGLSIANALSEIGKKVLIIEKNEIGYGASGSCDDMIFLQTKKPGILLEMALESLEIYKAFNKDVQRKIEFENRGGNIIIENQDQLDTMSKFVSEQNKYGLEVEIIEKKYLKKMHPFVSNKIIAATYSSIDSQVNPMLLMKEYYNKAKENGMEIKRKVFPIEINNKKSNWEIILNDKTIIQTTFIVNATGSWANDIMKLVDEELPIMPKRGQILVTEQLPKIGKTNILSAQYIVSKLNPNIKIENNNKDNKIGLSFSFTNTENGNYLVGSTREFVGFDKSTDPYAIKRISEQLAYYFPIMEKVNFIRTFSGFRPATSDGLPFIGEIENKKGFFIAAGHEGDGIALSPITGKVICKMIQGEKTGFNIEELNPSRLLKSIK